MKKPHRIPFTIVLLAILAGCASVRMASPDTDKAAKQFTTAAGQANLYVYRNESIGASIKMGVYVDDKPIGQTAAKTYLVTPLTPGMHRIRGHAENNSVLDLNAQAGQNYFVWQEVKMGFLSARNNLQLVDEATGKKGVNECKLAATGQ